MSIDLSGSNTAVAAATVAVVITEEHPLIKLANTLPWTRLIGLAVEDLKKTTPKGMWWTGRKIRVRMHLAAYLLQKIYNLTDRQVEYGIRDNAAFQLFCGKSIVDGWHFPDHTKIETFRSRLSPETQRALANQTAKVAVELGLGDPTEIDLDSTVQEANMAYPSDASLMTKLTGVGRKVIDYMKAKTRGLLAKDIMIDMKAVKGRARAYFFMAKNAQIEKRRSVFKDLHRLVKQQLRPVVAICNDLNCKQIRRLPWNIRRAVEQIKSQAWRYLLDVAYFTRTHTIRAGKVLAFHAQSVARVRKGKVGKENEFGRVFQLGRIKGNFLFVMASTSLRMEDRHSFVPMLEEHAKIFAGGTPKSVSSDKGYWSARNQWALTSRHIVSGLQRPANIKSRRGLPSPEVQERLRNRRAGIEPLIGHAKHGGQLGRSRMKSDAATLAAGYASVLGFNLRQLSRRQRKEVKRAA